MSAAGAVDPLAVGKLVIAGVTLGFRPGPIRTSESAAGTIECDLMPASQSRACLSATVTAKPVNSAQLKRSGRQGHV